MKKPTKTPVVPANPPIEQPIVQTLENNYMPYAMSVIISRAIPEIDGFKPAHRKLLYTMYKMGLLTGSRSKSADVVGTTMRLNPHGEGAIYETLVRLTRGNAALLHPFIDSKGNFGKSYSRDMAYAASRYTEVKLDALCAEIFRDIDKNTVDFVDNYNGTMQEPTLLPTTFPNLIVSPNQGIAVGIASSVCPFNLREVCEATINLMKNKDFNPLAQLSAPDFPTGGEILYDEAAMRQIYETGRGSFKVRAKWRFDKKNSLIEVFEIPYTTTIEAIIDKITALVKAGKIKDITDIRDETDLGGLKIAIDIRRSTDPDRLMQNLYASTPLMDSFNCNFNFLINGRPRTMGITEILREWLDFRQNSIARKLNFDLGKNREKLHLLKGLEHILLDIDRAISIIRNTEAEKDVIPNLCAGFGIDTYQADYIAEIRLRNLNREYLLRRTAEIADLEREIADIIAHLENPKKIQSMIAAQLREVAKKYGAERRSDIVHEFQPPSAIAAPIDDYPITLIFTRDNYFKKIPTSSIRAGTEQFLKEDDKINQEIHATNADDILFFSDCHNVYKLRANDIADSRAGQLGDYLSNLLNAPDERIVFVCATKDYAGHILFAFENGKIAKVTLESYATKTYRKKQVSAYSNKSPLVYAGYLAQDMDFLAIRETNMGVERAVVFNTEALPVYTTKNTGGITVLRLKRGSILGRMIALSPDSLANLNHARISVFPSAGVSFGGLDLAEFYSTTDKH